MENTEQLEKNMAKNTHGKGRIDYLDVAKGIGMLMVLWAHAGGRYNKYIYLFHMPLFFLISGYLYNNKTSVKEYCIRKIKSLYVPYVFWNAVIYLVMCALHLHIFYKDTLPKLFLTLWKENIFMGATWFLAGLFVVTVVYRILDEIFRNSENRQEWLLFIFLCLGICAYEIKFPYMYSRIIILSAFYAIGAYCKAKAPGWKLADLAGGKIKGNVVLTIFFAFCFIMIGRNNKADMGNNVYTHFASFVVGALMASYVTVQISKVITKVKLLSRPLIYISRNSISILIWQFAAFRIIMLAWMLLKNKDLSTYFDYGKVHSTEAYWPIVYTIGGVIISIIIGKILSLDTWKKLFKKRKTSVVSE